MTDKMLYNIMCMVYIFNTSVFVLKIYFDNGKTTLKKLIKTLLL